MSADKSRCRACDCWVNAERRPNRICEDCASIIESGNFQGLFDLFADQIDNLRQEVKTLQERCDELENLNSQRAYTEAMRGF